MSCSVAAGWFLRRFCSINSIPVSNKSSVVRSASVTGGLVNAILGIVAFSMTAWHRGMSTQTADVSVVSPSRDIERRIPAFGLKGFVQALDTANGQGQVVANKLMGAFFKADVP